MEPNAAQRLADTVAQLYEISPNGIAVRAIWISDLIECEQPLAIGAMLRIIAAGQLGIHTRYVVEKTPVG
jgi:hypothetical protein